MASQTQGIQQLLAAEKKAADKVAEARKRKCAQIICGYNFFPLILNDGSYFHFKPLLEFLF